MVYTVQPGDTLAGISIRILGSAAPAQILFEINRSKIKSGSPTQLAAGEKLIIPEQMISGARARRKPSADSHEVTLEVGGIGYVGWTSVRIGKSLETAAASFEVEIFDRWEAGSESWPIYEGDEVRVYIGAELLVDGYVDEVRLSIDANSRGMSVSGRDRTADLVDCSAMNRPGTWTNQKLEVIASAVAAPFGVVVETDQDTGPALAKFTLIPGEKAYEAIARAAIAKNLIVTSGKDGKLLLTRSGSLRAVDAIVEGKNLLAGDSSASAADRFSDYIVEGQAGGQGQAKNGMKATYHDAGVSRYRPLMLHSEQKATPEYLQQRGQWEARSRAARARSASVSVVGWWQSNGELWKENRIVGADSPSLGLAEDFLIGEVVYETSIEGGRLATLRLVRPDAYTSEEQLVATKDIMRNRGKKKGGGKDRGVSQAEYQKAIHDLPNI